MEKKYISPSVALLTAIGFMIGSGIFFRAPRIVTSTEGNVVIAILAWLFMGATLIFAGMAIAEIASRSKSTGGFVGYVEEHLGKKAGFIVGWYQVAVYIPLIVAVLALVIVDFSSKLFGFTYTNGELLLYMILVLIACFTWNYLSTIIAGLISASATVIKLIPLIAIAILGVIYGNPGEISGSVTIAEPSGSSTLVLFMAPLLSMAFAFDGWLSAGALAIDMKNPQKDLPKIFVGAVVITTIVYTTYFIGINSMMDPNSIIAEGNGHVGIIANRLFGGMGEKLVLICVVISVLGTMNAIFMSGVRYTLKLAQDGFLPGSSKIATVSRFGTYGIASVLILIMTILSCFLYYFQNEGVGFLQGIGLDDIPIALNAVFYVFTIGIVFKINKQYKGELSFFKGVVIPAIGIFGQLFIAIAFFVQASNIWVPISYMTISILLIGLGFIVCREGLNSNSAK